MIMKTVLMGGYKFQEGKKVTGNIVCSLEEGKGLMIHTYSN